MLMPKRVKYRKQQRGRMRGKAYRGATVAFGEYGLQALEPAWITNRQIEAARVAITRYDQARRQDVDPRSSRTSRSRRSRPRREWARARAPRSSGSRSIKPGPRACSSSRGSRRTRAQAAMRLGASKLPIRTRFVERIELGGE